MPKNYTFDLYRLNIVDISDLFVDNELPTVRTDAEIAKILQNCTDVRFDLEQEARTAKFQWSVRSYADLTALLPQRKIHHVILARSAMEKDGPIVTESGLTSGTSSFYPPPAKAVVCLFDLSRHLVAIEHTGELSQTAWHEFFERIIRASAEDLGKSSTLTLEPVPEKNGILGLFESFERLTRIKMTLLLPNPELTRYTKQLYDELVEANIRELTQDMKNPNGLSKNHEARPYASAVIAEQGYKKGEVQFEGYRNNDFEVATTGSDAARGSVHGLREFVRGIASNAKTQETLKAMSAITKEIDRISPLNQNND